MGSIGTISIGGPAGRIEALYRTGHEGAERTALVCHPHPQHGGTMHNKVVFRAARAFQALGYPVLRFNYRGVGRSEGAYGEGIGEREDVLAAVEWLSSEHADLPIVLSGFSFGSVVGLPVGERHERVSHLVGIGTPERFPFDELARSRKPKLFVQGAVDEVAPLDALKRGLERVSRPWELVVVPGADHFFNGRLGALEEAIVGYFDSDTGPRGDSSISPPS